mgnify:CR=1 FL=1
MFRRQIADLSLADYGRTEIDLAEIFEQMGGTQTITDTFFSAAVGIIAGLWVGAATSFLLPVASFAAGCTAGAITERARGTLLSNRSLPPER